MESSIPPVQTQPTMQPTTQPAQPIPQSPQVIQPWYKTLLQKALANKSLSLFIAMNVISAFMGGYILLAPSNKTISSRASAYTPPNTPIPLPPTSANSAPAATATPTVVPTEAPTMAEELPTEIPTEIPTPTPTPDPTAGWNTYVNAQYSYSIKYPLNWSAVDLGVLEPKVPSYVAFNLNTASQSAKSITISVSTRTNEEQLAIDGAGIPYTVGSIQGTWANMKDSDGNASVSVILPRTGTLLILHAKSNYISTLIQMLPTLYLIN